MQSVLHNYCPPGQGTTSDERLWNNTINTNENCVYCDEITVSPDYYGQCVDIVCEGFTVPLLDRSRIARYTESTDQINCESCPAGKFKFDNACQEQTCTDGFSRMCKSAIMAVNTIVFHVLTVIRLEELVSVHVQLAQVWLWNQIYTIGIKYKGMGHLLLALMALQLSYTMSMTFPRDRWFATPILKRIMVVQSSMENAYVMKSLLTGKHIIMTGMKIIHSLLPPQTIVRPTNSKVHIVSGWTKMCVTLIGLVVGIPMTHIELRVLVQMAIIM